MDPTIRPSERVDAGVSVLRWPAEAPLRQQLASFGMPRILLVDADLRPPKLLDELEDWMRTPADPIDLRARGEVLRRRAHSSDDPYPILDDDGLLWMGRSWVAVTATQAPVVQILLDNLDKVVRFEVLATAYESAGGSGHPASVRTLLTRLGARLRSVGLDLITVRQRGVLLSTSLERLGRQA